MLQQPTNVAICSILDLTTLTMPTLTIIPHFVTYVLHPWWNTRKR